MAGAGREATHAALALLEVNSPLGDTRITTALPSQLHPMADIAELMKTAGPVRNVERGNGQCGAEEIAARL